MIRPVVGGGGRTYLKQNLFHPRMIRPVVGGGGRTYLKQPPEFRRLQFVEPVENQGI